MNGKYFTNKRIAIIAILSAIAAILMVFDFPVSFVAPSFYKLDISDLPCLIGSFALGPLAGVIIEILKILIKLIIKPTSSAFVGELANLAVGCSLSVTAGFIYKKKHNKKGALMSLIFGSIEMIFLGALYNYFVMLPFYESFYNFPLEAIISAGQAIVPFATSKLTFVLYCVVPFNALKALVVSVITYFLYKRISPLIHS